MKATQEGIVELMHEILGDSYVSLAIKRHTLEEDFGEGASRVRAILVNRGTGEERTVEGAGVGLIDAFFKALVRALAKEYPSLDTIQFRAFSLNAEMGTGRSGSRSDSVGTARLDVDNQQGRTFSFTDSSRSVTASCIRVTLSAVEYFVNSERTFYRVRELLADAVRRNRQDLAQKYGDILEQIVRNAPYAPPAEKL